MGAVDLALALAIISSPGALTRTATAPRAAANSLSPARVDLAGPWRFRIGDDPAWAAADLDLATWRTAVLPGRWDEQGLRGVEGPIWFRRVVALDAPLSGDSSEGWGLLLGRTRFGTVDVWINGVPVGSVGGPALPVPVPALRAMAVPREALEGRGRLAVAIRVVRAAWASDRSAGSGPVGDDVALGHYRDVVDHVERARLQALVASFPWLLASSFFLVAGLGFSYLQVRWRFGAEHLWFGLVASGFAANTLLNSPWAFEITDRYPLVVRLREISGVVLPACFVQFLWTYLGRPISPLLRAYQGSFGILAVAIALSPGLAWVVDTQGLRWLWLVPLLVGGLSAAVAEARRGSRAARGIVLVGVLLSTAELLAVACSLLGWPPASAFTPAAAFAVFVLAIGLVLAERLSRMRAALDSRVVALDRAEQALRRSEQRLRLVLDNTSEGLVLWSLEGPGRFRVAVANRAFVELVHRRGAALSSDDLLGLSFEETLGGGVAPGEADVEVERRRLTEVAAGDRPTTYTLTLDAAGTRSVLDVTSCPVADEQGRCTYLLQTLRDVTEQRRTEATAKLLAQAIRSINECVSITDRHHRLIFVNESFARTYGYDEGELIGQKIDVVRSPSQVTPPPSEILAATLAGGWRGEIINRRKDGSEFPILLSSSVVHDDDGEPIGLIGVTTDISERRRMEAALRRRETMSALGSLVGGVAHEVRNPLFAITGLLDAFEATAGRDPRFAGFVDRLRAAADRLVALMRSLLEYGRPVSDERTPTPLRAVVLEAARQCQQVAAARGVEVRPDVPEELPEIVLDPPRMVEALRNIVENGVLHSPSGGAVAVVARSLDGEHRGWLEVQVRDSGPGFGETDTARLLEPFVSRRAGGTGLGLSIVSRVVAAHGGEVTLETHPQGGAVVTVRLPVYATTVGGRPAGGRDPASP